MRRTPAPSSLTGLLCATLVAAGFLAAPALGQDLLAPVATDAPAQVRFETTLGGFTVELDARRAPRSVDNLLQYVRERHYDGTVFHRVIGNFVVQGGGFTPDGSEKPTRTPVVNESGNGLSNRRGTFAMARTDDPHSATSQFYVNLVDNLALDPGPTRWGYAVIGRVIEGMDVVERIASVATNDGDTPLEPVVIASARVVERAAPAP